jgi:ligand-binding sensor domain-containing protein/two-component sensor histidine kinase
VQKIFFIGIYTLIQAIFINCLAQQTIFKIYAVSDGLVNNSVRRVFQDSKGFLWIATWEGLSKYDGNRFTNFTESNGLSHSMVNDIIETPDGIYVAMNNGSVDVIKNDKVEQKGVIQNIVINRLHLTKEKKLLGLTDNFGIIEINGKKIKHLTPPGANATYSMVALNDSLIATAALTYPVFIYDQQFRVRTFVKTKLENTIANCVYKDLQNRLWLGTSKGLKLVSFNKQKNKVEFVHLPPPFNNPLLSQFSITCIFQQQNGTFWIGTEQGLINVFPNGQMVRFTEKDGLPSRYIGCIFNDRENNLWIGTSLGLVKINAQFPIQIHGLSEGPYGIASLMKKISTDELLISSGGFLSRYNFRTGRMQNVLRLKKDAELVYVTNSAPPLFIYQNQLNFYDATTNSLKPITKIPSAFAATTTDNNTIFSGAFNGVTIYVNGRVKRDSIFTKRVETILADHKGNLWIGTWNNGLYRARFNTTTEKWMDISHLSQLPDNHIRGLFEDSEGDIWAGTRYRGAVRIKENDSGHFELTHFNQQNSLSSNWVGNITEDEKGNIWLANNSGLDKLIKTGDSFNVFNFSRVMNFFTTANLVTHIDGNKFFCSSVNGIFLIKDNEFEQILPKPVYLTKINLGTIDENEPILNSSEKIILPYSKNHALFEFTSPTYLNEKAILFSYRLKGSADTAWSHPSNSHSVQYASLEPGHYQFEVRMLGWNGSYGPVTSFLFTINPPYWGTWWFYLLIGLCILFLLYCLYRYRINQLIRLQKVRNTIATDLHDDIGSTLTNISILSELSKKNLQEPRAAEKLLQRITEESVASQQALDDIIWSVNTRNDNMQELQARMRRYVAEVFESSNISCQFNFENATDSARLNMEQRRDLYLVFKECLNNIHKHASAKNIYIKISVNNGILNMQIQDDGKGFDPNITTHRNGLKNLETRVVKWKGSLKIDAAAGKGARIEIMMPVKTSLLK